MALFSDPKDLVKNTPLLLLDAFKIKDGVNIYAKLELQNPAGGIKDRIGLHIVNRLFEKGELKPGMTIVEATAGNTGLGLAFALANTGVNLILVIPSKFSIEKQQLLRAMGAQVINTDNQMGMNGAIEKAKQIRESYKGSISISQFSNPENPNTHYLSTAPEIFQDLRGRIDYFVAGAGSGGTYSGIMRFLKEKNQNIVGVLADPNGSIIGGGIHGNYAIEGIGNSFIPESMDMSLVDKVIKVNDNQAYSMVREIAKRTGIFVGSSSGANLVAALELAKTIEQGNIVTIFYDRGERYFSQSIFEKCKGNGKSENRKMEKIKSFTINHLDLNPGIYESRRDTIKDVPIITYDLRVVKPNAEPVMNTPETHTIEHLGATYLRNHQDYKDRTIYFGPMGCRTGFYLILIGESQVELIQNLVKDMFVYILNFNDEIPGAEAKDCGNYLDHDLKKAKFFADKYIKTLLAIKPSLEY